MDSESSILKAAKSFFAGTLFSRVLGMLRDISMAFCFGSAPEVAAFMVAYRLANLFRRLFGEGSLQGGFVPHFEKLRAEGEEKAALFYRDLFCSLWVVLLGLVTLGGACCWVLAYILDSDIPFMTLAMMPGVAFLCFYALDSAVLQCKSRFFLPAFAPVVFNLVWILSALCLRGQELRSAMFGLSYVVVGAFLLQWMVVAKDVARWGALLLGKKALRPKVFSAEVRTLFKPLAFGLVGIGAAQINSALDAIFARVADLSGPAYLWYAIRIQQLPLALFGIALSGALLPALSRASSERCLELLQSGLKKSVVLMIPFTVGMIVLARPGLDLLYGHGGFSEGDVFRTGLCLMGYAVGLVPMVYVLLLANACYSRKEYRLPMKGALAAVFYNLVLNAIFVFYCEWGAHGIALATSLSSLLNCLLLKRAARQLIGKISLWRGVQRIGICSLLAGFAAWTLDSNWVHERNFSSQLACFTATGGLYAIGVIGLAYLLKVKELFELIRIRSVS